jgi:hypothetical protein
MAIAASTQPVEKSKRDRYLALHGQLKTDRSSFDGHWKEIARVVRPRRTRFTKTKGKEGSENGRHQDIIDSTATTSSRTLASGLHAGLTSPARPWFRLTTPNPQLAEHPSVKPWLHEVTTRMLTVMQRSNLYNALPILYQDVADFGTAAMGVYKDDETVFRCYAYPIGSYAVATDRRGRVSVFAYETTLTVLQLVQEYGGEEGLPVAPGDEPDLAKFSRQVQDAWRDGNHQHTVEVCWLVQPNERYDAERLDARRWPFSSCHFEVGGQQADRQVLGLLREAGFNRFPILVPRWDVTSHEDSYGTDCPGMTALGDIRQLQSQQKIKGKALEKIVNPPLQGPTSLMTQTVSLLPAAMNFVDVRENQQGIRPVHDVTLPIGDLGLDIQQVQQRIKEVYYVNLFLMLAATDGVRGQQPLTAREVDERHEEKLIMLGPVLERLKDEVHDPLIDLVWEFMMERSRTDPEHPMIPETPEVLDGVDLPAEYESILAQAQRLVEKPKLDALANAVLMLMSAAPQVASEVGAKLNFMDFIDAYAEVLGVDPRLIRSDDEARAILQQMAEAQARQAQAEQMEREAKSMASLSKASLEGDTALRRLMGGA